VTDDKKFSSVVLSFFVCTLSQILETQVWVYSG